MQFTKMHGLGNDFVVVSHFEKLPEDVDDLARRVCDRHFGVGADGLVFILPSQKADIRMRIMNADGTEAEQCGNAIRCVAKYAYEREIVNGRELAVETGAGIQYVWLEVDETRNLVTRVKVDMGVPRFNYGDTDGSLATETAGGKATLSVLDRTFPYTFVSMGNPHAVTFMENASEFDVDRWGPLIESHEHFPNKTNVEFVTVQSPELVDMRVWERGVGQTLACGTGACAVAVAGVINHKTGRKVTVRLKGGDLFIEWNEQDGHVYMTGAAEEVFRGEWLR